MGHQHLTCLFEHGVLVVYLPVCAIGIGSSSNNRQPRHLGTVKKYLAALKLLAPRQYLDYSPSRSMPHIVPFESKMLLSQTPSATSHVLDLVFFHCAFNSIGCVLYKAQDLDTGP